MQFLAVRKSGIFLISLHLPQLTQMFLLPSMLFPRRSVNPSEISYSPDDPLTKLIKPKCPNTSHM